MDMIGLNLLEIVVIVVLLLLVLSGLRKGFVKKLASMISLVVSIVLVSILLPYMTEYLKEHTPVYEYIVEQCQKIIAEQANGGLAAGAVSNDKLDAYRNMGREQLGALLAANGYDSSMLDALSDDEIEQYKEQYLEEYLDQHTQETAELPDMLTLSDEQQESVIENLPLPESMKKQLLKYNNQEGYRNLKASTFQDYIVNYVASAILNILSFILAIVLVQIILWLVIRTLDLLAHVPGISFVNRLAGGALGLLQGLFVLWLFFLVLSMCSATEPGLKILSMVQESEILTALYNSNLFVQIVLRAAAIFV
ncbi:MAG: CvpA family protein [Lachnospiraceae bacterium]|nr:CvpA family protein [Lachnospiraceae bacterium]